jgi:hypothetical protein
MLLNDAVGLTGGINIDDSITLKLGVIPTGQYSLLVYFRNLADAITLPTDFKFQGQGSNEAVRLDQNIGATANSAGAYYVKSLASGLI